MSILRTQRSSQPQGPTSVDKRVLWAFLPLTTSSNYISFEGGRIRQGAVASPVPSTAIGTGRTGFLRGIKPAANTGFVSVALPAAELNAAFAATGAGSVLIVCKSQSAAGHGSSVPPIFALQSSGSSWNHYPYTDGNIYVGPLSATRYLNGTVSGATAGIYDPHVAIATAKSGAQRFYVNGILRGSGSAAETPALNTTANTSGLGEFGSVYVVVFFDYVLSDSEIKAYSANPWQLFAPVARSIWVPVAAGGPVTHATTGALTGQLGSVAGTAAHVAVHWASGTPTGQLGSVAGSAARLRAFSSTGALTGQGASIVGSAARAGGTTTHDATGTPTGQGSAVVGTAAHVAVHGTSGTLVGTSALLAGTSVHNIPHGTSGDLIGPGSVVVGSALNGLASITKSGVNRLWLIDYYTKEFAAKERLRNPEPAKTKVVAKKRAAEVAAKVEASVAKAEKDLATLTKSMKDVQDAQVFIYNAIQQAKQAPQAEPVDFMAVAKRYEKKMQQEEHELLLLAMVL